MCGYYTYEIDSYTVESLDTGMYNPDTEATWTSCDDYFTLTNTDDNLDYEYTTSLSIDTNDIIMNGVYTITIKGYYESLSDPDYTYHTISVTLWEHCSNTVISWADETLSDYMFNDGTSS